jgi:hypothetical protein
LQILKKQQTATTLILAYSNSPGFSELAAQILRKDHIATGIPVIAPAYKTHTRKKRGDAGSIN